MSHSFPSEAAVIGDWLVKIAKRMGLSGATMIPGAEGFGHHRKIHSVHSIELTDQPLEVVMILTEEETDRFPRVLEQRRRRAFLCEDRRRIRQAREVEQVSETPEPANVVARLHGTAAYYEALFIVLGGGVALYAVAALEKGREDGSATGTSAASSGRGRLG